MTIMYTATEDHITVLTVGSSLRKTLNWSIMFVFTLVQSRTHVETVQTVLDGMSNSRDICWSHTMKALASHVTFVSSSSLHAMNWSYIHFDVMKMWSRMFAVNVQSVSVQWLNLDVIVWFTQTTNSFVVVVVVNVSNTEVMLYIILSTVFRTQCLMISCLICQHNHVLASSYSGCV